MTEEEIRAEREQCADCGGALEEISVLDNQTDSVIPKPRFRPFRWFHKRAQNNGKSEVYTADGTILTFRCSRCGRITFYGAEF